MYELTKDKKDEVDLLDRLPPQLKDYIQPSIDASFSREKLDVLLNNPNTTIDHFVVIVGTCFSDLYDSNQLGLKYRSEQELTLRQHSLKVGSQFDKYFSHVPLPAGISKNFMRFIFALHDIAKPFAIGNNQQDKHGEYSALTIEVLMTKLSFSPQEIGLAKTLVQSDPIGTFLKARGYNAAREAAHDIKRLSEKSGLNLADFFNLLLIYYKADASSYTTNAGGEPRSRLNQVFVFDQENREMHFSSSARHAITMLESYLFDDQLSQAHTIESLGTLWVEKVEPQLSRSKRLENLAEEANEISTYIQKIVDSHSPEAIEAIRRSQENAIKEPLQLTDDQRKKIEEIQAEKNEIDRLTKLTQKYLKHYPRIKTHQSLLLTTVKEKKGFFAFIDRNFRKLRMRLSSTYKMEVTDTIIRDLDETILPERRQKLLKKTRVFFEQFANKIDNFFSKYSDELLSSDNLDLQELANEMTEINGVIQLLRSITRNYNIRIPHDCPIDLMRYESTLRSMTLQVTNKQSRNSRTITKKWYDFKKRFLQVMSSHPQYRGILSNIGGLSKFIVLPTHSQEKIIAELHQKLTAFEQLYPDQLLATSLQDNATYLTRIRLRFVLKCEAIQKSVVSHGAPNNKMRLILRDGKIVSSQQLAKEAKNDPHNHDDTSVVSTSRRGKKTPLHEVSFSINGAEAQYGNVAIVLPYTEATAGRQFFEQGSSQGSGYDHFDELHVHSQNYTNGSRIMRSSRQIDDVEISINNATILIPLKEKKHWITDLLLPIDQGGLGKDEKWISDNVIFYPYYTSPSSIMRSWNQASGTKDRYTKPELKILKPSGNNGVIQGSDAVLPLFSLN